MSKPKSKLKVPGKVFPAQHTRKITTVEKKWNHFLLLPNNTTGVLTGSYSMYHKRFKHVTKQGGSVSLICAALAELKPMYTWDQHTLDFILNTGLDHHKKSMRTCRVDFMNANQVEQSFFLENLKVSMFTDNMDYKFQMKKLSAPEKALKAQLDRCFEDFTAGIYQCNNKFQVAWYSPMTQNYFLFDPLEHNLDGGRWTGFLGDGYSCCTKFLKKEEMVAAMLARTTLKEITDYIFIRCRVEKVVHFETEPPPVYLCAGPPRKVLKKATYCEITAAITRLIEEAKKPKPKPVPVPPPPAPVVEKYELPSWAKQLKDPNYIVGDVHVHGCRNAMKSWQKDRDINLATAVAALTMLKKAKSKKWVRSLIDDVLTLGKWIFDNSPKLVNGELCKSIPLNGKQYQATVDAWALMGQVGSKNPNLLDVKPAIREFMLNHDCVIISNPEAVAIWREEEYFYMLDPMPRDWGRQLSLFDEDKGLACLIWFGTLEGALANYCRNVDMALHSGKFFHLWKVDIKDYVELPAKWYNFEPMSPNRWILRGTFSQANKRFGVTRNTQCTANATIALAYSEIQEEKMWDSNTVDSVLLKGNEFYIRSVDELKAQDRFKDPQLMVDEVLRQHEIDNKLIDFEIDDCLVNGIINAKSETGVPNLRKGFEQFFDMGTSGIVTANLQSMAFWHKDNTFYYYDSHSRNDKGIACSYGTACLLRLSNIDDLTKLFMVNLGPNQNNLYNISRIKVKVTEINEDGVLMAPWGHYEALNDYVGIIRSTYSTRSDIWKLNTGKQWLPMAVMAVGMNELNPANDWRLLDIDQVMIMGNKYYTDTMEIIYANQLIEQAGPVPVDDEGKEIEMEEEPVTPDNIKKEFYIGTNQFNVQFEEIASGNYEENLREVLETQYNENKDNFRFIFESEYLSIAIWKDDHLIYIMDPKPRDANGGCYGKEQWPVLPPEEDEDEEEEGDDDDDVTEDDDEREVETRGGGDPIANEGDDNGTEGGDVDEEDGETEEERARVLEEEMRRMFNDTKEAWKDDEGANGRSCILRFARLDDLIGHIDNNAPQPNRTELMFTLKKIVLNNKSICKNVVHEEIEEKPEDDPIAGSWYNFREMDHGKWILRGSLTLNDELFPEPNRNHQLLPTLINCFFFVKQFSIERFCTNTVDDILRYGDRLYTHQKRWKMKHLVDQGIVTEDESVQVLAGVEFEIDDYVKRFCVFDNQVTYKVKMAEVCGDYLASLITPVLNIPDAISKFLHDNSFGVLEMREYNVAIFKRDDFYFMFDCHPVGPNGIISSINGVPAFTRYSDTWDLARVFISNLPEDGSNLFEIHAIKVDLSQCVRSRVPEVIPPATKLAGYHKIIPGREILRGTVRPTHDFYEKSVHIHSAPIAFIALAITMIQNPETWTTTMVDKIMKLGASLHALTTQTMGDAYNPWNSKRVAIDQVVTDFKLGSKKANLHLGIIDQMGLCDVKQPTKILNLRQGIEIFFRNNTHGILTMGELTLAIWEQDIDGIPWICIFDPNPRGNTGLPVLGGRPCTMKYLNPKLASDHLLSSLRDEEKEDLDFTLVPVDILVGDGKPPKKFHSTPEKSCQERVTEAQKRAMHTIAHDVQKESEAKKRALIGRFKYFDLPDGASIIRGGKAMLPYREVATNLVACVMMSKTRLDLFTYRYIDILIECGNLLYIDLVVNYDLPLDGITLSNVPRRFYMKGNEVEIEMFKPVGAKGAVTPTKLVKFLERFFEKETYCMLNVDNVRWVSLYWTKGFYYYFEPMACDCGGKRVESGGAACILKCGDVATLAERLYENVWMDVDKERAKAKEGKEDEKVEDVAEEDAKRVFYMGVIHLLSWAGKLELFKDM